MRIYTVRVFFCSIILVNENKWPMIKNKGIITAFAKLLYLYTTKVICYYSIVSYSWSKSTSEKFFSSDPSV